MKRLIITAALALGVLVAVSYDPVNAAGGVRVERRDEGGTWAFDLVIPSDEAKQVAGRGFLMGLRVDPTGETEAFADEVNFADPSKVRIWYGQVQNKDKKDPLDFYFEYVEGSCDKGECRYRSSGIKPDDMTFIAFRLDRT